MNKLDYALMGLGLQVKILFSKFLYYFMFRDCKQFTECTEAVKRTYTAKHEKKGENNHG